MKRLKASQVPAATLAILKTQGNKCPLCNGALGSRTVKTPALDHDHQTGYIRGVLCVNCNGIEGKVFNLARRTGKHHEPINFLKNLVAYYEKHAVPQYGGVLHHTHKTEEEKRLARLKRAKLARAKAKESK